MVSAQCSDLFWVLENRQGIPISLAVIAMGVAHACGLRASGVNFPGHFLLDVEGDLVDPVTMQPVAGEQIQQLLQRLGGEVPTASLLRRTQPADVALRMLNNLKALALQTQDYEETLQLLDLQLAIAEGTSAVALQVERGNVWLHLGHKEVASQCFTLAASQTDDEALLAQIFERLQSAGGPEGVLH